VLVAQGDLAGARARFEEGLDIVRRLAAGDPSSAGLQRDLSFSLNRVGDVLRLSGQNDGAVRAYGESAALLERLAATEPKNAWHRWDLLEQRFRIAQINADASAMRTVVGTYRALGGHSAKPFSARWIDELEASALEPS